MSTEFYYVMVAAITVVSAARITRLLTFDKFPPIVAVRNWFLDLTERRQSTADYGLLAICGYCMAFWVALVLVGWGDLVGIFDGDAAWGQASDTFNAPAWFFVNGVFAAAYLAAIVMRFDGDKSDSTGSDL